MDLGATVCRPSAPDCLICPFFASCRARALGKQENIPLAATGKAKKKMSLHVGLIRRGDDWALRRRSAEGLYAGMWEFPAVEAPFGAGKTEVADQLSDLAGNLVRVDRKLPPFTHVLTHRELRLQPWLASSGSAEKSPDGWAWRPARDIRGMAVSSYTKKLLDMAEASDK